MPNENEDVGSSVETELCEAERRVVDRLRRARWVAREAVPDVTPTFEDLIDLDEMIQSEGWQTVGEE